MTGDDTTEKVIFDIPDHKEIKEMKTIDQWKMKNAKRCKENDSRNLQIN